MLYDYLKIAHILSATLVVTSLFYSYQLWRSMRSMGNSFPIFNRIQKQTVLVIVPGTLIQLGTGFTLISLQHYPLSDGWVSASISGFIVMIASWLGFIYFLCAAQQEPLKKSMDSNKRHYFYQKAQSIMLLLCALALCVMIFSMANKGASLHRT